MPFLVASHFLAGSILSLVLPAAALVAVGVYWWILLRRRASGAQDEKVG